MVWFSFPCVLAFKIITRKQRRRLWWFYIKSKQVENYLFVFGDILAPEKWYHCSWLLGQVTLGGAHYKLHFLQDFHKSCQKMSDSEQMVASCGSEHLVFFHACTMANNHTFDGRLRIVWVLPFSFNAAASWCYCCRQGHWEVAGLLTSRFRFIFHACGCMWKCGNTMDVSFCCFQQRRLRVGGLFLLFRKTILKWSKLRQHVWNALWCQLEVDEGEQIQR